MGPLGRRNCRELLYILLVGENLAKMLRNLVARSVWTSSVHGRNIRFGEIAPNVSRMDIATKLNLASGVELRRPFHTTLTKFRDVDNRKLMLASMPKQDQGTEGEADMGVNERDKGFGG